MNNPGCDVAVSWSGGKDSCLAFYKALRSGYKIAALLNFISREYKRCSFHGTPSTLLKLQAQCLGIPLFQEEVSPDMKEYEKEFKLAVEKIKAKGIKKMVFGDIYLDEHKNWVDRVCGDLNIEPIEPLWGMPAQDAVREFIGAGFKTVVASAQADKLGREFVGRVVDESFVRDVKKLGICPCGENGEFHTFVFDGPLFNKKIEITKSETILKKGFWEYWFLDIQEYNAVDK